MAWAPATFTANSTIIEAALLTRMDLAAVAEKSLGAEVMERAEPLRGSHLLDLCRAALISDQQDVPRNRMEMVRAALSTLSLPIALGDAAGKILLSAYTESPATWQAFCGTQSVSDFKVAKTVRPSFVGELEEVPAGGELKHGTITEAIGQIQARTFGKMLSLDRKDILNDDLSLFDTTAAALGRSAMRSLSDLVYQTLLSNAGSFFSAGHGNYLVGADTVLSVDGLSRAIALMLARKDAENHNLDIRPTTLLVPPELQQTAKKLLESEFIQRATNTPTGNPIKNAMRLNAAGIRTPMGRVWEHTSVSSLLRNPVFKGALAWNRTTKAKINGLSPDGSLRPPPRNSNGEPNDPEHWIVLENIHEPLVSADLWQRVQDEMKRRSKLGGLARPTNRYLLSGLVKCNCCGFNFVGHKGGRDGKTRYYQDSAYMRYGRQGCDPAYLNAAKLDAFVLEQVRKLVGSDRAGIETAVERFVKAAQAKTRRGDRRSPIEAELKAAKKRIESVVAILTDGELDDLDELRNTLVGLRKRRIALEAELAAAGTASPAPSIAADLRAWATKQLDEIVSALEPGSTSDATRRTVQSYVIRIDIDSKAKRGNAAAARRRAGDPRTRHRFYLTGKDPRGEFPGQQSLVGGGTERSHDASGGGLCAIPGRLTDRFTERLDGRGQPCESPGRQVLLACLLHLFPSRAKRVQLLASLHPLALGCDEVVEHVIQRLTLPARWGGGLGGSTKFFKIHSAQFVD